jgi:hypothetical protein
VIGDVRQVFRFPSRDHFAACNGTAPVEVSSGGRRSTGCRCAATAGSTTRSTRPRSPRSGISTARAGPTTTRSWLRARPTRRRSAASSAGSATRSTRRWWPMPGALRVPARRAREGNRGTALYPGRPAHTPSAGSSDKPLPGLPPPYGPARKLSPQVSPTECFGIAPRTPSPI